MSPAEAQQILLNANADESAAREARAVLLAESAAHEAAAEADRRSELVATTAERDQAIADRDAARAERDSALATLAAIHAQISAAI